MPDLATQIRTYLDDTAPPVTFDEIFTERIAVLPLQPTRLRPIPVRGRGPLIAVAAAVVVLAIGAATAILTLSGDGGNDVISPSTTTTEVVQPLQSDPVTSFGDVAGTYLNPQPRLVGSFFALHIFEDGTWHIAQNPFLVEDLPEETYETRFEGTEVFLTETQGDCGDDTEAIYEIGLLENGNLQFVPIEDTCGTRSRKMVEGEFEPFVFGP